MLKLALPTAALASLLLLGACSGPAEDAAHREADAVEAKGEQQADALENQADAAPNAAQKDALNRQADAVEEAADDKADAIERKIDKEH